MNIIDKREGNWRIILGNEACPHITYPRSDVACRILEDKNVSNSYCCAENCPRKKVQMFNPKQPDWKDKTCEKCEFNEQKKCRRFPGWVEVTHLRLACAEYKEIV